MITGAGSGVGGAVAQVMRPAGFSLVLAGRRIANLEQTAVMAGEGCGKILVVSADVRDPDSVRALFEKTRREFGRLVGCRRVTITRLSASRLLWPMTTKSCLPSNSMPT